MERKWVTIRLSSIFYPGLLSGEDIFILSLVHRQLGIMRHNPTSMFQRQSITATLGRLTIAFIINGTA